MSARERALRETCAFNCLSGLTAVDFWPKEPRFEVVYVLVSIANRQRLRMKVRLPADDPHVTTFLADKGLVMRRTQAELKGIAGEHSLYSIEPRPLSV